MGKIASDKFSLTNHLKGFFFIGFWSLSCYVEDIHISLLQGYIQAGFMCWTLRSTFQPLINVNYANLGVYGTVLTSILQFWDQNMIKLIFDGIFLKKTGRSHFPLVFFLPRVFHYAFSLKLYILLPSTVEDSWHKFTRVYSNFTCFICSILNYSWIVYAMSQPCLIIKIHL